MCRLFERFRDDNAKMLSRIVNLIILQRNPALTRRSFFRHVIRIRFEFRRIFAGKNLDNARRRFCGGKIDTCDTPVCDRTLDQRTVDELWTLEFRGISGRAGAFESSVDASERLAYDCRAHITASWLPCLECEPSLAWPAQS